MEGMLVLGAGYLGKKIKDYFSAESCDSMIHSKKDVEHIIKAYTKNGKKPVIFNCIGATGTDNIDWCEKNKEETFKSNVLVPAYIAEVCKGAGIYMVHLGTGCIYSGDNNGKGFSEDDAPNFAKSYYSITKTAAETLLKNLNVLQLRLRMPIDNDDSHKNLINKLLKYDEIVEGKNSITVIPDFLSIAEELINKRLTGVFNVVNNPPLTNMEILGIYSKVTGIKIEKKEISYKEMRKLTKAERAICTLSTEKLEKYVKISDSRKSLENLFKV